ncbi:MAG: hypothetical protein GY936_15695 [Ignavibacteriae bacterium]|nr:hypothetical protein [Ignavibacteriota bacterium]
MKLKKLINKSCYGSIGYIGDNSDIELLGSYLLHNKSVLDEFTNHVFTFTYKDLDKQLLNNTIHSVLPNAEIIILDENRGHNFGTADLDNKIIDYCKSNNIKWLCKASNDIILKPELLNIPINNSDFYYMNGIGYGGMVKYDFDFDRIIEEDFYPQTNFYFIDVTKIDYLYNKEYINETYEYIQNLNGYNGKIWEYIKGWSCEDFLKNCVSRNNLTKCHLVSNEKYRILLEMVVNNQIHDCSHKNIMIEGICHFQHPNENILVI